MADFNIDKVKIRIEGLKKRYTLVHISDCHISTDSPLDTDEQRETARKSQKVWKTFNGDTLDGVMADAVQYGIDINADAICCTGDIVDQFTKGIFADAKKVFDMSDKCIYVMGNHEGGRWHEEYKQITGDDTQIQVRELDEIVIVSVDNSAHELMPHAFEKLKCIIAGEKPVILLQHVPLYQPSLFEKGEDFWGKGNLTYFIFDEDCKWDKKREYYELLTKEKTSLKAILAGHMHLTHADTFENGVVQMVAAPCFTGYIRVVEISGE